MLDYLAKEFYEWNDVKFEYYTTIMINRNFKDYFKNPNFELIETIKNDLFVNMYGDKTDTVLRALSRGISGNCADKNWIFYMGNRDCGKGVQYDGLSYAFGDYVSTFEIGNIMYNRISSGI